MSCDCVRTGMCPRGAVLSRRVSVALETYVRSDAIADRGAWIRATREYSKHIREAKRSRRAA